MLLVDSIEFFQLIYLCKEHMSIWDSLAAVTLLFGLLISKQSSVKLHLHQYVFGKSNFEKMNQV